VCIHHGSRHAESEASMNNEMKDDEIENLFAWSLVDLVFAVILALCGIAGIAFVAGYLS
jgi:hypothetical protein